jgi:hypothetical protein
MAIAPIVAGAAAAALPLALRYGKPIAKTLWGLGTSPLKTMRTTPWKSAAGMGALGTLGAAMFQPEFEQPVERGTQNVSLRPPPTGPTVQADQFRSKLPRYSERLESRRANFLKHMKTIVMHATILQLQNPGRKNTYMKDAIGLIRMDALQKNEIELANMVDEVFKDKTVPKTGRTIYRRMIAAGASPKEASEVSGYTMEMEKAEAKAAADYAKGQPKMSDIFSKGAMMLEVVQDMYAVNPDAAINKLAQWMRTEQITLPDAYTGYEPKTDEDYLKYAAAILSGGGSSVIPTPSGDIQGLRVVAP